MKKALSLILALVLCLSLCACGGGNSDTPDISETTETTAPEEKVMTKEEMLEQAVEVDVETIRTDTYENILKAKSMYCDAVLLLEGDISEIKQDHIKFGTAGFYVNVYLPAEDLINLRSGQKIIVVGVTSDTIEEITEGTSYSQYQYAMPNAYVVQDKFEVTGRIHSANTFYENGFNFKIGDNPYMWVLFFDETFDRSNAQANADGSITVLGVVCRSDNRIYNAIVV